MVRSASFKIPHASLHRHVLVVGVPRLFVYGPRRTLLLMAGGLAFVTLLYTSAHYRNARGDYRLLYSSLLHQGHNRLDDQCHLPRLDPYDSSISEFLDKPPPLICNRLQPELTYVDERGMLVINYTALAMEHYTTSVDCSYRCFDKADGVDDVTLHYGQWTLINGTSPIVLADTCGFIDVSCSRALPFSIPVYSNTHFRTINKEKKWDGGRANKEGSAFSSVLLFVLDSISHSNFVRNLPKTLNVLKTLYNVTVFDGYTKVGDNSLPNAVAFLTGRRVATAGYASDLDDNMSQRFYDDWPFVWKEYAKYGYSTLYAEDYPNYNLFQYMSNGFKHRPVDYYFRPFWVHIWNTFLHRRSTNLCYGNTPKHRLQLDYVRRVLKMHNNKPLFAFNWMTELGHDWMNQINRGDEDLAHFFTSVHPYLRNSLLIISSDHGHRFDPIRQTVIGRIEERMPFFAISLPSAWRESKERCVSQMQYNLNRNADLLTTPFDLHATLVDFLSMNVQGASIDSNGTRGSSLFRPLPPNRQCEEAHVPEEFCVCQQEIQVTNVSVDEKVQRAVIAVIDHLNGLLSDAADRCAALRLSDIRHAQTFLPNLMAVEDGRVSILYGGRRPSGFYVNYRVTFVTAPGDAVFESAVRYSLTEDTFKVIGDVNRINRYGDQSACIQSVLLRKFCYCTWNNVTEAN